MNSEWTTFFEARGAQIADRHDIFFGADAAVAGNVLCPVADTAVVDVTGRDAARFLQGQLTCNVDDLTVHQASLAAFCNAAGRTIAVLLVLRSGDSFRLLLPAALRESVCGKLQRYILRSDVRLLDKSAEICLLGLHCVSPLADAPVALSERRYGVFEQNGLATIRLPGDALNYYLIGNRPALEQVWTSLTSRTDVGVGGSAAWRYRLIAGGLPWFDSAQSEQYIPQMLNLEQLGAISFNKGCYTGQEVVARSHFLGKVKRYMVLAECVSEQPILPGNGVIDAESGQTVAEVLQAEHAGNDWRLLLVMQAVASPIKSLILNAAIPTAITLCPFQ